MREFAERFVGQYWDITVALPCSYWYLRGFDIKAMEDYISWFNVMSYDMNGVWNKDSEFIGPHLLSSTNLTEIKEGFDLLWRNDIDRAKVVMGMVFYGRSYTMKDPSCYEPGCEFIGCEFIEAGEPGDCSLTPGVLIYPGK